MNKKEFDFLKEILLKADGLYENDRGNLEIDIESINIKLTPVELLKMVQIDLGQVNFLGIRQKVFPF